MWFFTDEERELQSVCRDFAQKELAPHAEEHDREQTFNIDAFRKMGEIGVLGITADPEYGGAGLGAVASTIVMEEFGKVCASSTLSYLAHAILCVNNISANGSKAQKEKYLPKLISGEWIGCMGMSEPEFGSDAIGMQTKASKSGEGYLINGAKMWITNGSYADVVFLYTRTGSNKKDITSFIVEKGAKGFSVSKEIHKMGMRASPTAELVFENTPVKMDARVGDEGDSVLHMMKNLELERITISGISLGIAASCVKRCFQYASERKQFGKHIGEFQLVQKMLADMSTDTEMMKHFLYSAAKDYDLGNKGRVVAAQVKLALPRLATRIALDAVQLHGGYGYSSEFPLERYLRDAKLMEIGAGTNEVMIMVIARELLKQQG